jgi:hypothetical protein
VPGFGRRHRSGHTVRAPAGPTKCTGAIQQ